MKDGTSYHGLILHVKGNTMSNGVSGIMLGHAAKRALPLSWIGVVVLLAGCCAGKPGVPNRQPMGEPPVRAARTSPPRESDEERLRQAMRGLRYDSGYAEIDPETAGEVVPAPNPLQSPIETHLGVGFLSSGLTIQAVAAFTRAVIHDPSYVAAYDGLSEALIRAGRAIEGSAACRSALRRHPNLVETRARLALAEQMAGRIRAAADQWQEITSRGLEHPEAHASRAVLLYYLGEYAQAWDEVHAAEAANQNVPPQLRVLLNERMPEPPP